MSKDTALLRFPIPGLPCLTDRATSFVASGPDSAACFLLLWEHMLQRQIPGRAERADLRISMAEEQRRGQKSPQVTSSTVRDQLEISPMQRPLRDELWQTLCMESARQLPFEVHAMLWAAYVDPATGQLPATDLDAHMRALLPATVTNRDYGQEQERFLTAVVSQTQPNASFMRPHVRLTCAPAVWVKRDRDDQVHCHDGPAVVWGDGSSRYFWRGLQVPPAWFPKPNSQWMAENPGCPVPAPRGVEYIPPTAKDALHHSNLELRRMAMEIVGFDAVVELLDAKTIDADPDPQIGTLLEVDMPVPNGWSGRNQTVKQRFLRVKCGTGRQFSLSVPPNIRTAKAANAWTYGLEPDEYAPEVRT